MWKCDEFENVINETFNEGRCYISLNDFVVIN